MGDIQVAGVDDRFGLIEFLQMRFQQFLPFHSVGQSCQTVLGVWHIGADKPEVRIFHGNDAAFLTDVAFDLIADAERFFLRVDKRSGIAFLRGAVHIHVIPVKTHGIIQLILLHFGFLYREQVGVFGCEEIGKAFFHTGAQPVDIPGDQLHPLIFLVAFFSQLTSSLFRYGLSFSKTIWW